MLGGKYKLQICKHNRNRWKEKNVKQINYTHINTCYNIIKEFKYVVSSNGEQ